MKDILSCFILFIFYYYEGKKTKDKKSTIITTERRKTWDLKRNFLKLCWLSTSKAGVELRSPLCEKKTGRKERKNMLIIIIPKVGLKISPLFLQIS